MDTTLFRYLNSLADIASLQKVIIFCASYLQYVLGAGLILAALWPTRRYRMVIAAVLSAGIARLAVKSLIVFVYPRPRPFITLSGVHQLISAVGEEYQSFPSGHAIFFFALAFVVWRYNRQLGWWFAAGATLMGIGRVAAGIHWPSDILAGAVLGVATGYVLTRWVPALSPRRTA